MLQGEQDVVASELERETDAGTTSREGTDASSPSSAVGESTGAEERLEAAPSAKYVRVGDMKDVRGEGKMEEEKEKVASESDQKVEVLSRTTFGSVMSRFFG